MQGRACETKLSITFSSFLNPFFAFLPRSFRTDDILSSVWGEFRLAPSQKKKSGAVGRDVPGSHWTAVLSDNDLFENLSLSEIFWRAVWQVSSLIDQVSVMPTVGADFVLLLALRRLRAYILTLAGTRHFAILDGTRGGGLVRPPWRFETRRRRA